jgi:hypothetical protein
MKSMGASLLFACLLLLACLMPIIGRAGELNLATLSCDKYENEILPSMGPPQNTTPPQNSNAAKNPDSINTVMWLFGFSVAHLGEHVMYGDALTSFGFALDAECKNNPSTSLLEAVTIIRPKRDKPMDLTTLNCATFESRHVELTRTDPESADTIMMWLFGFSVGQSGSHLFDASALTHFASALQTRCTQHPDDSLFDALAAVNKPPPKH